MTCKLSCSLTLQRGNLVLILFIICKAQKHKYGGLDANFSQSNATTWLKPHVGQFIEIAKYGNRLPCSTKSGGAPIRQNSPLSLKQSFPIWNLGLECNHSTEIYFPMLHWSYDHCWSFTPKYDWAVKDQETIHRVRVMKQCEQLLGIFRCSIPEYLTLFPRSSVCWFSVSLLWGLFCLFFACLYLGEWGG